MISIINGSASLLYPPIETGSVSRPITPLSRADRGLAQQRPPPAASRRSHHRTYMVADTAMTTGAKRAWRLLAGRLRAGFSWLLIPENSRARIISRRRKSSSIGSAVYMELLESAVDTLKLRTAIAAHQSTNRSQAADLHSSVGIRLGCRYKRMLPAKRNELEEDQVGLIDRSADPAFLDICPSAWQARNWIRKKFWKVAKKGERDPARKITLIQHGCWFLCKQLHISMADSLQFKFRIWAAKNAYRIRRQACVNWKKNRHMVNRGRFCTSHLAFFYATRYPT